jgi:hypothetical protein
VVKGRIEILEGNQLFGRVPYGDSAATKKDIDLHKASKKINKIKKAFTLRANIVNTNKTKKRLFLIVECLIKGYYKNFKGYKSLAKDIMRTTLKK